MQKLNPQLTIIDRKSNSISIGRYAGAEVEECPIDGFKIRIRQVSGRSFHGMLPDQYVYGFTSKEEAENALQTIAKSVNRDSFVDLSLNTDQHITPNHQTKYFIGHGGSPEWLKLKDFLEKTLKLPYEEFNRIPQAGKITSDRLKEMLESCCMAFLIMTGEDEHTDGTLHARSNVIHEIGLFQAQLGYERAIILLEKGCEDFSNIHGITYISFPKGNIRAAFEDIRDVLKRESII